ncbi:MAG: HAD-IIA family hydrolase [Tannerellaceae bacterium]|jgi:NagD protein|nr:HAD-IIA family hydrolase [Tannerellaceae bacterium]
MNYYKEIHDVSAVSLDKISKLKHIALDMDGTIYNGKTLFPFTIPFLNQLRSMGITYSFLTNNPSKSTADYLIKLNGLGINATEEEIYTSAQATIDYLKYNHPNYKRLFLLGTPSMIEQFGQAGYISTQDSPDDEPDALIVAFDRSLNYQRLCRAAWWAKQGKPYFSTNPDWVCPTDQPVVLVDCGSICACIEASTGRKPDYTVGKPQAAMLDGIIKSRNLKPEQIGMVGDRIYTDMMMTRNAHAYGILVLTGEATLADVEKADFEVDLILPSIEVLGNLIDYSHQKENNV